MRKLSTGPDLHCGQLAQSAYQDAGPAHQRQIIRPEPRLPGLQQTDKLAYLFLFHADIVLLFPAMTSPAPVPCAGSANMADADKLFADHHQIHPLLCFHDISTPMPYAEIDAIRDGFETGSWLA